jgi:hypothetical protein
MANNERNDFTESSSRNSIFYTAIGLQHKRGAALQSTQARETASRRRKNKSLWLY